MILAMEEEVLKSEGYWHNPPFGARRKRVVTKRNDQDPMANPKTQAVTSTGQRESGIRSKNLG